LTGNYDVEKNSWVCIVLIKMVMTCTVLPGRNNGVDDQTYANLSHYERKDFSQNYVRIKK